MGRLQRTRELARKRSRRVKLKKLRAKYAATKNEGDKAAIVAKVRKISPFVKLEEETQTA